MLAAVEIPDDSDIYAPDLAMLPAGWEALPTSSTAPAFGGAWLADGKTLGMLVPSVLVHEEFNMVLNPRHPDYGQISLSVMRPFVFDQRMFK